MGLSYQLREFSMALLPEKKSERIKIYILVLGCVVFVVFGYFRFLYKKPSSVATRGPAIIPLEQLQVPRVEIEIPSKIQTLAPPGFEALPDFVRDIFSPLTSIPSTSETSGQQQSAASPSAMELMGTIVGGGKPLAIINDQFVGMGDRIGKYRVIRIKKNEVLLDSGHHQIKLEMVEND